MAYNPTAPADDQTLAAFPPEMREQLRAIINDQVVNALKVMGLSPGNASGNIAVSNGTRCINLNADKLDDKEAAAFAPAGWVPPVATGSSNGSMSNTDKAKLDTIAQGAEVNQNAFSSVLVGSTTIQADSKMDTFELVAGQNIGITPDATNDRATIAVTGKVTSAAAADKWTTVRTLTLSGDCTGSVSADGSQDMTLTVAVVDDSHNHIISNIDGLQSALDAKASLDSPLLSVPPGTYIESACPTAPAGYLLCDGSAVSRTIYAALFAAIGTTYGAGNGSTTFNLPDRRDRFALAKGTTFPNLGANGGEINHTLTANEIPSHGHSASAWTDSQGGHQHSQNAGGSTNSDQHGTYFGNNAQTINITSGTITSNMAGEHGHNVGVSIANTGGGAAHNNMPPYFVVNYFIKY